jgi:hypothetical protein
MKIESEKRWMDVHKAGTRLNGATIDGIAVTDLLAYWRAGHGTKSA